MKWFLIALALFFTGCVRLPSVPGEANQPQSLTQKLFGISFAPAIAAKTPATAKNTPLAKGVSKIVRICEIVGALCLLGAGGLGYTGNIIPAVKVGLAGIALIVFGVWFNYYYGIVIAIFLLFGAACFLWAWYKNDPSEVKALHDRLNALIEHFEMEAFHHGQTAPTPGTSQPPT